MVEDLDLELIVDQLTSLGAAFLLALPLGWDRERSRRSAGLRTFPIVALASCAFVLLAEAEFVGDDGGESRSRVVEGVITGIGFVGGGAILKSGDRVRGTATAAAIWATGAIGVSVAMGHISIAIAVSLVTFVVLVVLSRYKHVLPGLDGSDDDR